ncbi:MAG: hypothetical protein K0Q97_2905 [Bacillota bacterium]|jgi:hypothetical protein|nr:hypothetical protein [Bacillota bacterium]
MEKKYTNYIIVVLLIMNFFTILKLNSVENSLDNQFQRYKSENNDLRNEIQQIYYNVDSKLKKQASLLDSYDISFGEEINTDKYTVPITISVTPKEYSEDLKISMIVNNEKIAMEKNNSDFKATYDVNVFEHTKFKVVLEKNNVEKVETLDEYSDLQYKYILSMDGAFSGKSNYSSGKYQYEGDININFFGPSNNKPVEISLIKDLNGTVVNEQEIDISDLNKEINTDNKTEQPAMQEYKELESNDVNFLRLPVDETIEISPNDKITLYVLVQDKYGLIYKYVVLSDKIDSNGKLVNVKPEWTNGSVIEITDKNGNILYKPDYIN